MLHRNLIPFWIMVLFILSACGSSGVGGTSPVNVDNDFWFGTAGNTYIGLGFDQSGSSLTAALAYADAAGNADYCCTLRGSLSGRRMNVGYTAPDGDSITISGQFSAGVTSFSGTVVFVINSRRSSFNTNLAYRNELSSLAFTSENGQALSLRELEALFGSTQE